MTPSPERLVALARSRRSDYRDAMALAHNGDCAIYYETFGSLDDPTLLMVNGLGSQCINYHEDWCALFVDAGFHVIRFDNRDVGLSTHYHGAPLDEPGAAYRLVDMAHDAVAVLDAIDVRHAHVMGLSMGGMIVQAMAIHYPERLLTMTSVMSRTGEAEYGQPTPEARALLLAPPVTDVEGAVERAILSAHTWGSPAYIDEPEIRRSAERAFERNFDPLGATRQFMAVAASGSWAGALRAVTTPTLVMHGTADTLIDVSGGRRTAELIPDAKLIEIDGMGHDYPRPLWQRWVDEVGEFCLR